MPGRGRQLKTALVGADPVKMIHVVRAGRVWWGDKADYSDSSDRPRGWCRYLAGEGHIALFSATKSEFDAKMSAQLSYPVFVTADYDSWFLLYQQKVYSVERSGSLLDADPLIRAHEHSRRRSLDRGHHRLAVARQRPPCDGPSSDFLSNKEVPLVVAELS